MTRPDDPRRSDEDLRALARRLDPPAPSPAQSDRVRRALLAKAARTPPRLDRPMAGWVLAAAAAAALVVGVWSLAPHAPHAPDPADAPTAAPTTERVATVTASGEATFEHRRPTATTEIVDLAAGRIRLDVEPLDAGHRFWVATGDAEIEVRGTIFEVAVAEDALTEVRVLSGRVEVRPRGRPARALGSGEVWTAAAIAARAPTTAPAAPTAPRLRPSPPRAGPEPEPAENPAAASPPASDPSAEPASDPSAEPAPAPRAEPAPHPGEAAFAAGWRALRAEAPTEAAEAFARAAAPGSPVAPEARYWRGVALVRAGRPAPAKAALREYLAHHGDGPRGDEAALLLARLLLDAGEPAAAEPFLERAAASARPKVRARAEALRGR